MSKGSICRCRQVECEMNGGQLENWGELLKKQSVCGLSINFSNFTAFNGFCTFMFPFSDGFIHFEFEKVFSCSNNKVLFTLLFISFSPIFSIFFSLSHPQIRRKHSRFLLHNMFPIFVRTQSVNSAQRNVETRKEFVEKNKIYFILFALCDQHSLFGLGRIYSHSSFWSCPRRRRRVVLLFAFIPSIILPIDVWPFSLALTLPYCHYYCYCWSFSIQWRAIHRGPYTRIP